ncbi:MAG: tetratricopeptide repeat protein [Proteobacteria bacterium]|nr:tetratricopeptide repeat protein [Pseudomonadota bacterium]
MANPTMDLKQLCQKAADGDQVALSDLKRLAEGGDSEGLFYLGFLYDQPSGTKLSKDSVAARQYYSQAAMLGHRLAQLCVGNMCDYGEGGARDLEAARHWYSAAAHQEVRDAQMHYGRMLETGRGGRIDIEEAAIWYSRAVEQGDELAATNLALLHLNGLLNESNVQLGMRLLQYSAEMLDGVAHLQLGQICEKGKIVQQNLEIATTKP